MKTNSAVCKLTLWTSKKLKNGSSPIVLTIRFGGQSIISTGFSCFPKDWNERQQCLKKTFPNSAAINGILLELLNRANAIRIELDGQGIDYTHKQIAERIKNNQTSSKPKTFKQVLDDMIEKRSLRSTSAESYNNAYLAISRFLKDDDFLPSDINNDNIKRFAASMSSKKVNTILCYITRILTVLRYADKLGISLHIPSEGIDYIKSHYKRTVQHRALTEADMLKLTWLYQDKYEANKDGMLNRTSKQFALGFFICGYEMQGLAPSDMCLLKTTNVTKTVVNGVDVYKIVTKRIKTSVPVTIIVKCCSICGGILEHLLLSASTRNNYIFPILGDNCNVRNRLRTFNTRVNSHLNTIASEVGIEKFSLYAYRHSFCSIKLHNGANIIKIAQAMGRNVNGIQTYIRDLSTDEDLLRLSIL